MTTEANVEVIVRRDCGNGGVDNPILEEIMCSKDCAYTEYQVKMEEKLRITLINRENMNPQMDAHINFVPDTACDYCLFHDGLCSPNALVNVTSNTTGEIKGYGERMLNNFGDAIYARGKVIQFTLTFKKIRDYCRGPHALRIVGHSDNKHFEEMLWFRVGNEKRIFKRNNELNETALSK